MEVYSGERVCSLILDPDEAGVSEAFASLFQTIIDYRQKNPLTYSLSAACKKMNNMR